MVAKGNLTNENHISQTSFVSITSTVLAFLPISQISSSKSTSVTQIGRRKRTTLPPPNPLEKKDQIPIPSARSFVTFPPRRVRVPPCLRYPNPLRLAAARRLIDSRSFARRDALRSLPLNRNYSRYLSPCLRQQGSLVTSRIALRRPGMGRSRRVLVDDSDRWWDCHLDRPGLGGFEFELFSCITCHIPFLGLLSLQHYR